jgi:hypothetical protein
MDIFGSKDGASDYSGPPPEEHAECIIDWDTDPTKEDFFYGRGYLGGGLWHIGAMLGLVEPPEEYRDGYIDPGIHPE